MTPTTTGGARYRRNWRTSLAFYCLLALAPGLADRLALAGQSFLSPQSSLILLVGVPGDAETEQAYRGQLQAWLDLIAGNSRPRQLVLLCDLAPALHPPATIQSQVLTSTKLNFLGLTNTLAGDSSPAIFVVWGHGGSQGVTPVFHVRGPRLTPEDFLAVSASRPNSKWILWFRGSGGFAHPLASAGRTVLSSECETKFASDPIGMSILLKTLRSTPELGFDDLARQVGADVGAWYAERNLARTEEPTLWIPGEPPRRLMVEGEADHSRTLRAAPQTSPTNDPGGIASVTVAENVVKSESRTRQGLPDAWRDVKPVDPSLYPETEGVVLRQRIVCTLGASPALTTEKDQYIQVLSAEGKRLGDFDIASSPPEEEVELLDCDVLLPDGTVLHGDPEVSGETQEHPGGDYRAGRRRFFSLPSVLPGAVLHVHYRTQWKEFPLPQVSMALPLSQDLPVLDSNLEVNVPKERPFHFAFEGVSAPDPSVRQTGYSTTYSWHLENTPASLHETLSSPHQGARLVFSTFPDWAGFADWYERITRLTAEPAPEISAKAKELTRSAGTGKGQVLALYNYVTMLRYVAVPLGVNSVRPHAAVNVLRNQFGDCKDKANLLNALLHAVNIDAHLVLVPRFGVAHDEVPGLAFNHAISRVRVGPETLWLDTTDDICRFGLLPPGDPGRTVLVLDGHSTSLTRLPPSDPGTDRLKIEGDVDASEPGASWPVKLHAVAYGFPDYQFREAVRESKDELGTVPVLAMRWRPATGSFALEHQVMTPISQLDQDFSWQAAGSHIGLSSIDSQKGLARAPFWLPKEWDLALHKRHSPLFLNQGYPVVVDEDFRFHLPQRISNAVLPSPCENVKPPLRWRIEWTRVADDLLLARFHAELLRGELSAEDTSVFQQQLRGLFAAMGSDATYTPGP